MRNTARTATPIGLDTIEQVARDQQQQGREHSEHQHVGRSAEVPGAGERAAQPVDTIGQRVQARDQRQRRRHLAERKQCSRQEEQRQHQEIHDQRESLEIGHDARYHCAQRGEEHRDQHHIDHEQRQLRNRVRPESQGQTHHDHDASLHQCHGCPARGTSEHDEPSRHRCDQGFLDKSELLVPDQLDAREHGTEQDPHADDTRGEKLQVIALPRPPVDTPEAKAEREQVQQWLT